MRCQSLIVPLNLLALLLTSIHIHPQTVPQIDANTAVGPVPYQTYTGTHESLDLENGNLSLSIPILHIPGRAGHDLDLSLTYNSKIWQVEDDFDSGTGIDTYYWDLNILAGSGIGWRLSLPSLTSTFSGVGTKGSINCYQYFIFTSPDGASHSFSGGRAGCVNAKTGASVPSSNVYTGESSDFYVLDLTNSSDVLVIDPHGTRYHLGDLVLGTC